jgi:hypothetical protein
MKIVNVPADSVGISDLERSAPTALLTTLIKA